MSAKTIAIVAAVVAILGVGSWFAFDHYGNPFGEDSAAKPTVAELYHRAPSWSGDVERKPRVVVVAPEGYDRESPSETEDRGGGESSDWLNPGGASWWTLFLVWAIGAAPRLWPGSGPKQAGISIAVSVAIGLLAVAFGSGWLSFPVVGAVAAATTDLWWRLVPIAIRFFSGMFGGGGTP